VTSCPQAARLQAEHNELEKWEKEQNAASEAKAKAAAAKQKKFAEESAKHAWLLPRPRR